jgi:uncharacterized damage-inducible protein DinB
MEQYNFVIEQLLNQWKNKVNQTTEGFRRLSEGSAMEAVAPDKNTAIYLLGHLITVHDGMFEALNLGERNYPDYDGLFLTAQHADSTYPDFDLLLERWISLNDKLYSSIIGIKQEDWLTRHHYVSDADFLLEPHRNKLSILLTRFAHMFHHGGQLALIKKAN